jgi:hypothetical protein
MVTNAVVVASTAPGKEHERENKRLVGYIVPLGTFNKEQVFLTSRTDYPRT